MSYTPERGSHFGWRVAASEPTDYTTPADRMAPLAAMLIGNPNLHGHALVQHIISTKGRADAVTLFQHLAKEAEK